MADTIGSLAGSRLDSLRFVLPGAYATAYLVVAADATRLHVFEARRFGTEWAIVALLASFLLGYLLHLIGIRSTARKKAAGEDAELEEAFEAMARGEKPSRRRPRGPHDVVNVLRSSSTLQWSEVRPMVIAKFNRLTRRRITQADLDKSEKLRWFVYHFCYSYLLKTGAAAEVETNRGQYDLVRAFIVALWFGFAAGIVILAGIAFRAHVLGPASLWWASSVSLGLALVGLAAPFLLGGLLHEQLDRASKRLAGAVYEGFLAT